MKHMIVAFGFIFTFLSTGCAASSLGRSIDSLEEGVSTQKAIPWLQVDNILAGLEGPAFDRDGNFYVTIGSPMSAESSILKITPDKEVSTIWTGEATPVGIAFHKDQRMFVVSLDGQLLIMTTAGEVLETLIPTYNGQKLTLNDLSFNKEGDLYVTDWQGSCDDPTGGVFLLSAESGYSQAIPVAEGMGGPNGLSLSPDEKTIWVGEHNCNIVSKIDLETGNVTTVYENEGEGAPDSNKVDASNNLYQAMNHAGRIDVLNTDGELIQRVTIPGSEQGLYQMSTNLAIKPGTNEAFLVTAGQSGEGQWIFTFKAQDKAPVLYGQQ